MRASVRLSVVRSFLLPAFLFAFAPSGCGGEDARQSSATGQSTASAGGSGGAGSGGAGGAAGSASGGTGGGIPCMGMGGCDAGYYCNAPGCGAGTCVPKSGPAEQQQDQALVCGCDNVTYWNESIASYQGVGVKAMGACPAGTGIACSQASPCSTGLRCNRKALSDMTCTITPDGECWGVPLACGLTGPYGYACSNDTCASECVLIQSQNPWYGGVCTPVAFPGRWGE